MIAYLKGVLAEKEPTRAVVEAAGVGYELLIPVSTFDRLPKAGEPVRILTRHCVREDDETLFGFATEAERSLFGKLVSVSGVGPKIAIAILSGSSIAELSLAIASGNARRISAIKGVGRKTAEKICVELKDKVSTLDAKSLEDGAAPSGPGRPFVRDAILALVSLGFNEEAANRMVSQVLDAAPGVTDVETVIRKALASGK